MVRMDETNSVTSTSAAAVANGARSTVHANAAGVATMKSDSHVKLLIKSSNQQYEDHVIESDLLWTVNRLKSHLSVVYPSKPPVADQKLIYSGQLLNDHVQLKDIIRSYKDVYTQNHIIHLVYTPKNLPPITVSKANKNKTKPSLILNSSSGVSNASGGNAAVANNTISNMSTTGGIRHRHAVSGDYNNTDQQATQATVQQQQPLLFQQQMHPYFITPQLMSVPGMSCPQFPQNFANGFSSPYNVQAMITQQTAMYNWMQQVYSQYMEQCLRLSNTLSGDSATNSGYPSVPPNFPQMFQQQFLSTVMTPPVSQSTASPAPAAVNLAADGGGAERLDQQQQPALAQVAPARFQNMQQDEQDNRDWLDNFFSMTRFALFLTLLYFNSSPLRCFVVIIIAGGIYLYHIGVFRIRHERNNNNLNRNNNAAQNAAVDQIRQGVDQQQNAAAAPDRQENSENNDGEHQAETTTDTPEDVNDQSMLSAIRTFVVTFFTSLLPETPAL